MSDRSLANPRKAAIVVASLDPSTADKLLEQMEPRQAALVRRLMVELGEIPDHEATAAIEDFFRTGLQSTHQSTTSAARWPASASVRRAHDDGGVELDIGLARRLSGDAPVGDTQPQLSRKAMQRQQEDSTQRPSFDCLQVADNEILLPFLLREHPQTAVLVLSHLSPQRAADVLARLPAALQSEVLQRLSHQQETSSSVLAEVERELEAWIDSQLKDRRRRQQGLAAVQSILQAAEPQTKQALLARLSPEQLPASLAADAVNPNASDESSPHQAAISALQFDALTFDDVARLDDAALLAVYRRTDPDWVVLALAGAAPALVTRLVRQLNPQEAKSLQNAISDLGPTRLSDLEAAQQAMADIAGQMAAARRRGRPVGESADRSNLQAA